MVAELTTRKKLDLERQALNADIVANVTPINAQVVASHKTALDSLTADYVASEKAIEDNFKVK